MRIFVTGATGFIGRALTLRLQRDHHAVVAWARCKAAARDALGDEVEVVSAETGDAGLKAALSTCDAIVNLAGAPIVGRWSAARKQRMVDSRIGLTRQIVAALSTMDTRPGVLISGSAVGYYGMRKDEILDPASPPGTDFLARLCVEWEFAARRAEASGVRVVLLRTGIVLGRGGGALAKMLPVFRMALGGRFGAGTQYVSWIHLHDYVEAVVMALQDERVRGPFNITAPQPVRNCEFAAAVGRAVHRRAALPIPAFVLKGLLGESADALLASQRALPDSLCQLGFRHRFPSIDEALQDLTERKSVTIERASPEPHRTRSPPLKRADRPFRYQLRSRAVVDRAPDEVFPFFSQAHNIGPLTPPSFHLRVRSVSLGSVQLGLVIEHELKLGPLTIPWRARIVSYEASTSFIDEQERGPYRSWRHEHTFVPDGARTVICDHVYYTPPWGVLGRIAHRLFIAHALQDVFEFRIHAMRLRFGSSGEPRSANVVGDELGTRAASSNMSE